MNELNKFIEIAGQQWIEQLNELLKKGGDNEDAELYNAFINLVSAIRISIIDNDETLLLSLKNAISIDLIYQDFVDYVKSHSGPAFAIQPLRELASRDLDLAQKLLCDIIKNNTVRQDPNFSEAYSTYGLVSEKEMLQIENVVTTFAEFLVENAFTKAAMKRSARTNLYLGETLETDLAQLVDQNYREIQLRLIIKGLHQE